MSLPGFSAEASLYGKPYQGPQVAVGVGHLTGTHGVVPQQYLMPPGLLRWLRCNWKYSGLVLSPHTIPPLYGSCMYDCIYRTLFHPGCATADCYVCCEGALQNCYATGQFLKGPCCTFF